MEIEKLLKQLQDWTNRVPLIILGSGASVPFGLPSMWSLGKYIKENVRLTDTEDLKQFEQFKSVFDETGDLETTLSLLNLRENVLIEIVSRTWEMVNEVDLKAYEKIITNSDDFPLLKLTEYLLSTSDRKLTMITTNYDRLGEYAASLGRAIICTGYAHNYMGHFSAHIHDNKFSNLKGFSGQVDIWKVHGSLDWFKNSSGENLQLPLRHKKPDGFTPLIVTPGLSKYSETHMEPYRTIFAQADKAIEEANGFLCLGYGFNDAHVQPKLISEIKNSKPIIVITKQLTPKTKQSIIENKCKNYILLEESGTNDTQVYSSYFGDFIIPDVSCWILKEYLKLIIS
jgi:hypothetical protein